MRMRRRRHGPQPRDKRKAGRAGKAGCGAHAPDSGGPGGPRKRARAASAGDHPRDGYRRAVCVCGGGGMRRAVPARARAPGVGWVLGTHRRRGWRWGDGWGGGGRAAWTDAHASLALDYYIIRHYITTTASELPDMQPTIHTIHERRGHDTKKVKIQGRTQRGTIMIFLGVGTFQIEVLETVQKLGTSAYGMKIRDELSKGLGREIHMPQIYAALARLVKLGLLKSSLDHKQSAGQRGRTRRVYSLSASGLQMLSGGVRNSRSAREKELFINEKPKEAPAA